MSSFISVSDSLHTSILASQTLQQQYEQRFKPRPGSQVAKVLPVDKKSERLYSYGTQILLTASCLGLEMNIAFETVYTILTLQYLGVPLYLVSLNQVISGVASMVLIPVIGFVTDRGRNANRRKLVALFGGGVAYIVAPVSLIMAALLKYRSLDQTDVTGGTTALPSPPFESESNVTNITAGQFDDTSTFVSANTMTSAVTNSDVITLAGILGIVAFTFLEVGYDISMSAIRAFLLDVVPGSQHAQILSISTALAALGGVLFSALGILDLPAFLESVFNIDGMVATLILLGSFLIVMDILTYGASCIVGHMIISGPKGKSHKEEDRKPLLNEQSTKEDHVTMYGSLRARSEQHQNTPVNQSSQLSVSQEPNQAPPQAQAPPTHSSNQDPDRNFSISHASILVPARVIYEVIPETGPSEETNEPVDDEVEPTEPGKHDDQADSSDNEEVERAGLEPKPMVYGSMFSIVHSFSVSLIKPDYPPLGDFHNRKLSELQNNNSRTVPTRRPHHQCTSGQSKKSKKNPTGFSRNMIILSIAQFFSNGTLMSMVEYSANTLTIEIYHGDPTAAPGTEGNLNYLKGVRMASLGLVIYYCVYFACSLANKKVIQIIGSKAEFLLANMLLAGVCIIYFITKREELYFISMATNGLHKCMCYSVPVLLAAQYAQEGNTQDDKTDELDPAEPVVANMGRAMALLGFMVPAQFLLIGLSMGPLMDAMGTAWVPMYYCVISSVAACALMMVLVYTSRKSNTTDT